jgi:hypothetical protein
MKTRFILVALALPLAVGSAFAQDSSAVRISGFGTGALTFSDTDQAEFARSNQSSGAKKDPRTGVDSNLGLQADYTVNSWLSVTGQGLVRKDGADDFGAELSWAFVKAKLSDNLSVRVGRMAMPAFMISDYRNVGYANTFLRPPQELYSQMPINNIDGVDVTWQQQYGDTTVTALAAYGRSEFDTAGGAKAKSKDQYALNLTAEHGPFTLRVGRSGTKLSSESKELDAVKVIFDTSAAAFNIPQIADMGVLLNTKDRKYTFTSAGLGMDWNNIVVQGEYAKRTMPDSFLGASKSWYVMGGYRFGKFLPYYTHAKVASSGVTNTIPANCAAGAPLVCAPTLAALSGLMNTLTSAIDGTSQTTDSIGLRWDFATSAAVKVQVDRIKPQTTGLFVNTQPGFKGPVTVGAVALDFVF